MKKIHLILILSGLLFSSCNTNNTEVLEQTETLTDTIKQDLPVQTIEANQIATAHLKLKPALFKMKLDNSPGITLLDIRTPEELAENGTIAGAVNVNYYDTEVFEKTILDLDKELPVMLYCRSGGRSGEAAAMLKELGFKQVYDLNGGYDAWLEAFPKK